MSKRTAIIALAAAAIAAAAVLPPYFSGDKMSDPPPDSGVKARTDLQIIRHLEERERVKHGHYLPHPDGTLYYKEGDTGVANALPGFRPGPPEAVEFEYEVTTSGDGARFIAFARGKRGTRYEGKVLSIDNVGKRKKQPDGQPR